VPLPPQAAVCEAEALSLLLCAPVATRQWALRVQQFRGSLLFTSSLAEGDRGGTLRSPQSVQLEAATAGVPAHAAQAEKGTAGELVLTQRIIGDEHMWVLSRVPLSTPGLQGLAAYTQVCAVPTAAGQPAADAHTSSLTAMEALQVYSGHFLSGVGQCVVVRAEVAPDGSSFKATRPLRVSPEKVSHPAWSRSRLLQWLLHVLQWTRQHLQACGDAHQNSVAFLHCSGASEAGTPPRVQLSTQSTWSSEPKLGAFVPPVVPALDLAALCSPRLLRAPLPPSLHATHSGQASAKSRQYSAAGAGSASCKSLWCSRPDAPPAAAPGSGGCRLAIIVPFRDQAQQNRALQLRKFLEHMPRFIQQHVKPSPASWRIFVVQQSQDGFKFNRGKLLNIGAVLAMDASWHPSSHIGAKVDLATAQSTGAAAYSIPVLPHSNAEASFNALCLHDVDLLPGAALGPWYAGCSESDCIHPADAWPRYAAVMGDAYLGGILTMPPSALLSSNGFSNHYWGWGGEEDALALRLKREGVHVLKPPLALRQQGAVEDLEDSMPGERAGVKVAQGGRSEWLNMTKKELLLYEREGGSAWAQWDGLRSVDFTVQSVLADTPAVLHVQVDLHSGEDPFAAREKPEEIKQYTGLTATAVEAVRAKRQREESDPDYEEEAAAEAASSPVRPRRD